MRRLQLTPLATLLALAPCAGLLQGCGSSDGAAEPVTRTASEPSTGAAPARAPAPGAKRSFSPASVNAVPGSHCTLYPEGTKDKTGGTPVRVDSDGVARFHAVRAAAGDATQRLTLDCTDPSGRAAVYRVDLAAESTFSPPPFDLASAPGVDRPGLTGDPMSVSQEALLEGGYGLRPDAAKQPKEFQSWLDAARRPARRLKLERPAVSAEKVEAIRKEQAARGTAPNWVGTVLTGSSYVQIISQWNVPTAIPGGDGTGNTGISIWNGLGGYGTGGGLIQGGIFIFTNTTSASYQIFREYCCGQGVSNTYDVPAAPNPGDTMFSEQWYCNDKGSPDVNGGYGCSTVMDRTTGALLYCTSPTDKNCASVPALPSFVFGNSAEFIMELQQGPAFTDFSPGVTMTGSALTTGGTTVYSSDPSATLLTDFTSASTTVVASIGPFWETYWNVLPGGWNDVAAPTGVGGVGYPYGGPGFAAADPGGTAYAIGNYFNTDGNAWIESSPVSPSVTASWTSMPGAAKDVAASPEGTPWVIAAGGSIYRWNGSAWIGIPGCASSIGVGAKEQAWITGCASVDAYGNHALSKWNGSSWVDVSGAAKIVAVSPEGTPWAVTTSGAIYRWDGSAWQGLPGCAQSIGVGMGDTAWVIGCGTGNGVYQWSAQSQSWGYVAGASGPRISVTPGGTPWVVNGMGSTFRVDL